jgi:hypothetical protein
MNQPLTPKNRRANPRKTPKRLLKVGCYKGTMDMGKNLTVSVLDVSESGMRLILAAPLAAGQDVAIKMEGLGHQRPFKVEGKIVWSVETAQQQFCVGVRFRRYLPYAELVRLA